MRFSLKSWMLATMRHGKMRPLWKATGIFYYFTQKSGNMTSSKNQKLLYFDMWWKADPQTTRTFLKQTWDTFENRASGTFALSMHKLPKCSFGTETQSIAFKKSGNAYGPYGWPWNQNRLRWRCWKWGTKYAWIFFANLWWKVAHMHFVHIRCCGKINGINYRQGPLHQIVILNIYFLLENTQKVVTVKAKNYP